MERWHAASRQLLALQAELDLASSTLEEAMQKVVDGALGAIPGARGAVIELLEGGALIHHVGSGISSVSKGFRLTVEGSFSGYCVRTGQPAICQDSESDSRVDAVAARQTGTRSFIVAPIQFGGRTVGVLKLLSTEPNAFDERDTIITQLLTSPVALAIAHGEQARLAHAHEMLARRFAATFDQAAVGIAHVDPDGRFLLVNRRFCQIVGYSETELTEGGFQHITHPDDLVADLDNVAALLAGRIESYAMEKRYFHKSGATIWVNLTVSLVHATDDHADFFVAVIEDISTRKQAEALASYDPLTGLPNRRFVLEQLGLQLDALAASPGPLAVAYLDVNRFKAVNDRFGHGEGDRCLQAVADALRTSVRSEDMLGRIAGDEFVLLMPETHVTAAAAVLVRLQRAVDQIPERSRWKVDISAGAIVVMPGGTPSAAQVLDAADRLMYHVKRKGGRKPIVETMKDTIVAAPQALMAS